jgi:DNA invertase Pin-like site-specific DNA recombinase
VNVATYHRVSTAEQDNTLAREELRAAAQRLGELTLEVEEVGSGAKTDRPGLEKVMAAARAGEIQAIVVWKLDRFGRSVIDVLTRIRELESLGVRFVATTQGLDVRPGGDPMSRLLLGVLASVAEFERELIRERVTLGLRKAKEHGTKSGKPIGRPPTVQVCRENIKRLRGLGASWNCIAQALNISKTTARRFAKV